MAYEPACSSRINSQVSIHQLLEFVEPIFVDKTALIDGRQYCTYGQLADVESIAALLEERAIGKGHRLSHNEIETLLHAHLEVVLGMEDEGLGRQLVTGIQIEPGFDLERLSAHCEENLPWYMQPRQILVFGALPLSPNGKIDRPGLTHLLRARLAASSESHA